MLIAAIFICSGLFIFTSNVSQITNEPSTPEIKLILNLQGFLGVLLTFTNIFHRCQLNG